MSLSVKRKIYLKIREQTVNQVSGLLLSFRVMLLQHLLLKKQGIELEEQKDVVRRDETELRERMKAVEDDVKIRRQDMVEIKRDYRELLNDVQKGEHFIEKAKEKRTEVVLRAKETQREVHYLIRDRDKKKKEGQRYEDEITELEDISHQHEELIRTHSELERKLKQVTQIPLLARCSELENHLCAVIDEEKDLTIKCAADRIKLKNDRTHLALYEKVYNQNHEKKLTYRKELAALEAEEE